MYEMPLFFVFRVWVRIFCIRVSLNDILSLAFSEDPLIGVVE